MFKVVVRLDRWLPRTRLGARGSIALNGESGFVESRLVTITRQHPCFTVDFQNQDTLTERDKPIPGLQHPRDGRRVAVALSVRGSLAASARVAARRATYSEAYNEVNEHRLYRQMGCIR